MRSQLPPRRATVQVTAFLAALSLMWSACGSPAPPAREFVFTPVPYTVIADDEPNCAAPSCGDALSVDESDGHRYYADIVSLFVKDGDGDDVAQFAESFGFEVVERFGSPKAQRETLVVKVPRGSVDAAIEVLRKNDRVISADRNVLFEPATP